MVIIRFQGGLGNQLFQYALYKELQYQGKEVYGDISIYKSVDEPRDYELDKLGLSIQVAEVNTINRMCPLGKDFITKVKKNLFYRKKFYKEKNPIVFDPYIYQCNNIYLIGYFQTDKYFYDVADEIRNEIHFEPSKNIDNIIILEKMRNTESVSVHMRFGDYVGNSIYDNICTKEYYTKAIEEMKRHYESVNFFVISDDIDKAKKLLDNDDYEYVDWNRQKDSYYDMQLISTCKHNIMANSSFSWWGAWMNNNKNKIIIAPSQWLKNISQGDVWCNSWIKITPQGEIVDETII